MASDFRPVRLLVLEINEISWELMDPWSKAGELPNFARLKSEGTWGTTYADEPIGAEGLLEPWVTWTTFYTGVPHTEHGVKFLEQPVESIRYPRLWDIAEKAGKSIGVFASSGTWPPKPVKGFIVPGSFSPDSQTYPESLRPIQDMNLRYTRAHAPGVKPPTLIETGKRGLSLVKLGLGPSTVMTVAKTLLEIKRHPDRDWKKVCLQPEVNRAFFEPLWKKVKPDFATFHTNHVAHFQHRFMRAYKPDSYPDPTDPKEIERFGGAIRYGYQTADKLLGHFLKLVAKDDNAVLVVASSMGQQPYIPARYDKIAPPTCRLKSIEKLIDILGLNGQCEYFSTMAPQWNLRIPAEAKRKEIIDHLKNARYQPADKTMYSAKEVEDSIVLTPISHHGLGELTKCVFPSLPGSPTYNFGDLVVQADDTRKSGSHHPVGLLAFYGKRVKANFDFGQVNNLDVAPTFLNLLGVPVPEYMTGRNFADELLSGSRETAKV